jgi:hypothetical protein
MKQTLIYRLEAAINIPEYEIDARSYDLLQTARLNTDNRYLSQDDFTEQATIQLRTERCGEFIDTLINLIEGKK